MKFRKFVAGLSAVSMAASMSALAAFAADVTITAEKVTAKAGEEFTLKVDLSGIPAAGISAADFQLTYDPTVVTITGVSAGDIINTAADGVENFEDVSIFETDFSAAGTVTVTYGVALDDASYWVTKDGTFLTITGTVNADAADGAVSPVEFKGIDRETFDGSGVKNAEIYIGNMASDGTITNYAVSAVAGSVTVSNDGGSTTDYLMGDVDQNGKVDVMDIILLNKALFGKANLDATQTIVADVDRDGKPSFSDSLQIMRYVVKLVDSL